MEPAFTRTDAEQPLLKLSTIEIDIRNRNIDTEASVNSATVELSSMTMETNDWEELDIYSRCRSASFDIVIGVIEDIIMSPEFQELHNNKLDACYKFFSVDPRASPMPAILFEVFKDYSQAIAQYIETEIKKVVPDFYMESFVAELQNRQDMDGDIHELVLSLIDFKKFQEMINDYKNMKEGLNIDLSSGITVTQIHG